MQSVPTTQRNINAICALETEALSRRSWAARLGDVIATQAGKMWFIAVHAVWFTVWIFLNTRGKAFDPFPFSFLTMVVSLESIFLSLFIIMSQNRSSQISEIIWTSRSICSPSMKIRR